MKKSASPDKVSSSIDPRTIEEQIRARAYQLFEERGREEGHDWEDWFRAEEEIAARENRSAAA
jgi:DUF2934 family protein